MNSATQSCYTSAANVQGLSFRNIKGNIDIQNLNWDQLIVMNAACTANVSATTAVQQAVTDKLSAMAAATAGALSLGQTDTNNFISAAVDLSQKIVNAFAQSCHSAASNSQTITFDGHVGNITLGYLNMSQKISLTTDCVMNAVMDTEAAQKITQIIDSSATSKNAGLLDFLKYGIIAFVFIAAIMAVVAIVVGPKLFESPAGGGPPPIAMLAL